MQGQVRHTLGCYGHFLANIGELSPWIFLHYIRNLVGFIGCQIIATFTYAPRAPHPNRPTRDLILLSGCL